MKRTITKSIRRLEAKHPLVPKVTMEQCISNILEQAPTIDGSTENCYVRDVIRKIFMSISTICDIRDFDLIELLTQAESFCDLRAHFIDEHLSRRIFDTYEEALDAAKNQGY